jgi:uncharacterized NAD(P)/FAD-binding protein YdhS
MQQTIAILGAGFSGTLAAVHLLRLCQDGGLRVLLVERSGSFGRGLAYGTRDDNLLLNVPAGNMSALAEDPGHFVAYIRNIDPNFNPGSFIPRRIYGDYLEDLLAQGQRVARSALEKIAGEAAAVRRAAPSGGFIVELADGRRCAVDQVVLALGHFPSADPPPLAALAGSARYVADPWEHGALDNVDADRPVVLIGAGHTAVDTLFRLRSRGSLAPCTLLSRRGLLPHGHRSTPRRPATVALPSYLADAPDASARAYLHAIRAEVRRRFQDGGDWRDVVNELRPHTPELWRRLAVAERRRFLDRVLPYWDVHRHRLAPAAYLRLQRMLAAGEVEAVAARVLACEQRGHDIGITLRQRRDGRIRHIAAGAVINCTGPDYDIATVPGALVAQLRGAGLVRQDALQLGLEVDAQYRVIDGAGQPVAGLHYLGPMLKAGQWEAIAVPELRVHAWQLAQRMLAAEAAGPR